MRRAGSGQERAEAERGARPGVQAGDAGAADGDAAGSGVGRGRVAGRGADVRGGCRRYYDRWAPDSMALLREAGGVVDALHEYKEVLAAEGRVIVGPRGGTLLHPAVRPQAQAVRSLALLVKALGLTEE